MKSSVIIGLHRATSKSISSPSVSRKYSTSSAWLAGCLRAWQCTHDFQADVNVTDNGNYPQLGTEADLRFPVGWTPHLRHK